MNKKTIGYFLCESTVEPIGSIELKKDGRRVIGKGTLQRANNRNRNGRIYDSKDLFPALESPRSLELLKTGWGSENGHPMNKSIERQQTIDPNNVVAYFLNIWTEGDLIKAYFKGSNLPIGEAFDQDLRDGYIPAWSLRALGSLEETPEGAKVKNIRIITWDRVYYPSHPEAYTDGIVSESGIVLPNKNLRTPNPKSNENMDKNGMIIPVTNESVINYIKEESANFKMIKESFDLLYDNIKLINEGTQVQLTSPTGDIFICNLENHIHNEIMRYCNGR